MEKLKRREVVDIILSIKKFIFLKTLNIHSFVDKIMEDKSKGGESKLF
jgi:hypothetical protein